jgi:hypothetical protein
MRELLQGSQRLTHLELGEFFFIERKEKVAELGERRGETMLSKSASSQFLENMGARGARHFRSIRPYYSFLIPYGIVIFGTLLSGKHHCRKL